jgi:hypothetical protein
MNAHTTGDAIALAGAALFALAAVGIGRLARHHQRAHSDPMHDSPNRCPHCEQLHAYFVDAHGHKVWHTDQHQDQPCQDEPTAATSPPAEPTSTKR